MTTDIIPYASPDIGEEEIAEVAKVLRSGWITTGQKTREFEEQFRAYLGGDVECIAVNSATAGLHLALEAFGIGQGDEVITTTFTFTATAEVARYLGADVRLVDIDPVTLNIDVIKLREAIGPRTKAIVPVHYGGLACEMDVILAVAREHGLRVIEDAAHALPSTWQQRLIGTLDTDATVFSFYATKSITTGEGGMVALRNGEAAKRIRVMRLHGIDRDAFDRYTSTSASWYYEVVAPGFKYNLTDIASAIGIHQLAKLPRFLDRRKRLAANYAEHLSKLPLQLPADAPSGETHSWHLYPIRLTGAARIGRDDLIAELGRRGIGTAVHYVPLHRHPYWRDRYGLQPAMFPAAEQAYEAILSIPLYSRMTDTDQDRVIENLRQLLG